MMSRRALLRILAALPWAGRALAASPDEQSWAAWAAGLEHMQAEVVRRGWEVKPLTIAAPALESEVARVEAKHGLAFPPQLREVLLRRAARVGFGWTIPPALRPFEGLDLPTSGGLRDLVWDLAHIDEAAIPGFVGMRSNLADETESEQPNTPAMWDHHFPFAHLDNGDALAIDASRPDGPQPVRYFSDDLEGLHGHVIAPDLLSFFTAYIRLGCAGGDQDDWFRFAPHRTGGLRTLDPDGPGARRWLAWLARPAGERDPDEPPPSVPARTKADFHLIDAAVAGSRFGVEAALASGAAPDCVDLATPNRQGSYATTYETALILALRRRDRPAAERLLAAGASLDTRLLSVGEAVHSGTLDLVRWLLARGARANGWTGDRNWPIHVLLTGSADEREGGEAATVPMLEALLGAGADPDARWDGGRTMVMWCRAGPMRVLLEHGADPRLYDADGDTALHLARGPEEVRLLAAHGADVDALTRPSEGDDDEERRPVPHTPYQAHLRSSTGAEGTGAVLDALVAAGADPRRRDGAGRSTLWYAFSVADAERAIALGLDPREPAPDGTTVLFGVVSWFGSGFGRDERARALFEFYLGRGVDIRARARDGSTVLHRAAEVCDGSGIAFLLRLGADRSIRDAAGRLPVDRVPRSEPDLRPLLEP